jgi:hypothetical protein
MHGDSLFPGQAEDTPHDGHGRLVNLVAVAGDVEGEAVVWAAARDDLSLPSLAKFARDVRRPPLLGPQHSKCYTDCERVTTALSNKARVEWSRVNLWHCQSMFGLSSYRKSTSCLYG